MVAYRKLSIRQTLIDQLAYWRGIRLDVPARKAEAIRNIDNLLDEWNEHGTDG